MENVDKLGNEDVPKLGYDVWEAGLEDELNKLPYTKHLDDGQYNDGQLAGFELGATWGYNKAKETLYTEEQQEISDEEIEKAATLKYADIDYGLFKHAGFVEGCKWYREQLKQRK